jgi:hypothetical protein
MRQPSEPMAGAELLGGALVAQEQFAVRIEGAAEDDSCFTEITMNRTPISTHRLGNRIRIKDWPSASFPFPFVGIARCRESVLLERLVRAECSNAE